MTPPPIEIDGLVERWRHGPIERPRRVGPVLRPGGPIFSTRPWSGADGDPGRPQAIGGVSVVEVLRVRADSPGSLVALSDGRFAICGRLLAIGSREHLADWARRRLRRTEGDDEREWLREALGALAF